HNRMQDCMPPRPQSPHRERTGPSTLLRGRWWEVSLCYEVRATLRVGEVCPSYFEALVHHLAQEGRNVCVILADTLGAFFQVIQVKATDLGHAIPGSLNRILFFIVRDRERDGLAPPL